MIQEIKTIRDVKTFFEELLSEGLNFHPDDQFEDYINYETKEPTYTEEEAVLRNHLLEQAFDVCEKQGHDSCVTSMMLSHQNHSVKNLLLHS